MPELPEVETVCRTLRPYLADKVIESFDLRWRRTVANDDLPAFEERIIGNSIAAVSRRGKFIVLELGTGDWITVHLRMTGELLFRATRTDARAPEREPYLRAVFALSGTTELDFYDTRKFGRIALLDREASARLDENLGVEPLSPAFTIESLALALQRKRRLKSLLLDQTVIAGLGNIYVDEAMFRAGVHPLRPASELAADEISRLQAAIVDVLSIAVESRGTTLRDYRSGLGEEGTNQESLQIYGRKPGSPCVVCGAPLVRLTIDQRTTMFCPVCQPLGDHDQA
ncbi:MAG: bifunctional DNA-formamidopyrimidine glycosylase/DNA-(apurinic or apyrimidinic site) lyase [Thermomicrobiales bacterium]|nr:bifunctional DNA-formamidopyrimidine glycosylase/DNA-(apurinic or apyrimidinic site) lyase [Thermomicrobiales bacterium]